MRISVVVATLGRPNHIKNLLDSLIANTALPDEMVIIEQGDIEVLEGVINPYRNTFPIKIVFQEEKSTSVARSTGVKESTGDVLFFFDDDMILDSNYIAVAKEYMQNNENVLGVTGSYMKNEKAWTLKRVLGVFFCVYSWKSKNTILPSGSNDYIRGGNLNIIQPVEWLYGGNMILRRQVFTEGFDFNHSFKKWSFGEDVMLTYGIHKAHLGMLVYLPSLNIKHNHAVENKMLNEEALRMKIIYRYIFWRREVYNGNILYVLAYLWSQVGLCGLDLVLYPSVNTFKTQIKTYIYLMKYHQEITEEKIDYNQFIFK